MIIAVSSRLMSISAVMYDDRRLVARPGTVRIRLKRPTLASISTTWTSFVPAVWVPSVRVAWSAVGVAPVGRGRARTQHRRRQTDAVDRDLTNVRSGQGAAEADDVDAADAAAGDADLVDADVADADAGEGLERCLDRARR